MSSDIGNTLKKVGKLGLELRRALAHGTFNGAMRFAQGGKFEHGFMSGFVSSLGGAAINNPNMSVGARVALSAVIGGTAEKLGGGKPARRSLCGGGFANGAVTGAYVMMFNHLMDHGDGGNPQKESDRQKLSLKDKDLPQKLLDEMKVINEKGFPGSNVSDLFDEESLTFGKNERRKAVIMIYDESIVEIAIVNPKFSPDNGLYYQVKARSYNTVGRKSFGTIDISGQFGVVNMIFFNKSVFNTVYDKYYERNK